MMMKKAVSVLTVILLCTSLFVPAFADTDDSALIERLILAAKAKLPIDDDEVTFRNYNTEEREGETTYSLYWESQDDMVYKSIGVNLEKGGTIRSYNLYESNREDYTPSFAKHTKEEAIGAARSFIASIDPKRLAETSEPTAEMGYNNDYTVTFPRVHNNIPVENEELRCTVEDKTLRVTNYNSPWSKMTFDESDVISFADAQKAFAETIGYRLYYQIVSEKYENTAKLVYRSRYDENVVIDAVTGEAMLYPARDMIFDRNSMKSEAADKEAGGGNGGPQLSAVERELVDKVSKMLSKEKADSVCRAVSDFKIDASYKLDGYSTYRNRTGAYIIQLRYRRPEKADGTGYGFKNVMIEAETGRIVNYYSSEYTDWAQRDKKKDIAKDVLKANAKAFLEKNYADEFAQMTEKEYYDSEKSGFEFLRVVNDVPVYDNGAWISFDEKTGELTAFTLNWTAVDFPDTANAAAQDKADEAAMKKGELSLYYVAGTTEKPEDIPQAQAVYMLKSIPVFDAETLESLDYKLKPEADTTVPVYSDIEGFYGEAKIQKLLANKIYLPAAADGGLHPTEAITQEAFLRLLKQGIWGDNDRDTEDMYRELIRRGILSADEMNPEGGVTRYEGITYLIRMLGYGDFVKIPDIFRCPFADVTPEQTGVAAVAWGLKLVSGDGGSFYPDNQLRRGDAMIILCNYLEH